MVVRRHPESGERRLDLLRWGLVPRFIKDLNTARKPFNARSKTAPSSRMFRGALKGRRRLLLVDAVYEWKAMADGRQPYAVARKDGAPMVMTGIWKNWHSSEGEVTRTFAIITTATNGAMQRLHDRMPLILERADWPAFTGDSTKAEIKPWPTAHVVSSIKRQFVRLQSCAWTASPAGMNTLGAVYFVALRLHSLDDRLRGSFCSGQLFIRPARRLREFLFFKKIEHATNNPPTPSHICDEIGIAIKRGYDRQFPRSAY